MKIDLFFFIGSLYSYLTIMRVQAAAKASGAELMLEQNNIPRNNPAKMRYLWRDVERRAARHGLAFRSGLPYPIDRDFRANRIAVVAADEGWCADYARATFRVWFEDHKAPEDQATSILKALGKDPETVMARAESPAIREDALAWARKQ
jgi:2-hydroxychromene-2-carboxylate isomerase